MKGPQRFWESIPSDKLPPASAPQPPTRPTNVLHEVSGAIGEVIGKPAQAVELLNSGFASATQAVAQALPALPAAALGSMAIGAPHAHVAHPPSGPPPIPPTPLPPVGSVLLGTCVSVLINGMPAARCGDLGMNPTCCGLPPLFEVFTGSSKVFIGGARAARVGDMTFHCRPSTSACERGALAAMRAAMQAAMKAMFVANLAAQTASMAGDAVAAAQADDPAMSSALALSTGMAAAQLGADAAAMALSAAMGKDPCMPPGTPGALLSGAGTVQIGGFPMPSWTNVAKGLARVARGGKGAAATPFGGSGGG